MGERRRKAVGTKGKTCNVQCKTDLLNNVVEIWYPCTTGKVLSTRGSARECEGKTTFCERSTTHTSSELSVS